MSDRDKVIKGLMCCKLLHIGATIFGSCNNCPYQIKQGEPCDIGIKRMFDDALALLKEQEEQVQIAHEEGFHDGYMQAMSETRPCKECQEFTCDGCKLKAVKWE